MRMSTVSCSWISNRFDGRNDLGIFGGWKQNTHSKASDTGPRQCVNVKVHRDCVCWEIILLHWLRNPPLSYSCVVETWTITEGCRHALIGRPNINAIGFLSFPWSASILANIMPRVTASHLESSGNNCLNEQGPNISLCSAYADAEPEGALILKTGSAWSYFC